MNLWHLLFIIFLYIVLIDSGKIRPNFDEIFGDGLDKKENEEKVMIKMEQNENMEIDQMGEEMGNDQNLPKSDQNINDQQKREIIQKFGAIKEKLREKGKYQNKNQSKIETKIAKLLGTNRILICKWKNELNLKKNKKMQKSYYEQKKLKFIERFYEFKELYARGKKKEFAKELGISEVTFRKWKKELFPKYNKTRFSNEEKLEKMKHYFEIKEGNPKMSDEIIAKELGIGMNTLKRWKKEFGPN